MTSELAVRFSIHTLRDQHTASTSARYTNWCDHRHSFHIIIFNDTIMPAAPIVSHRRAQDRSGQNTTIRFDQTIHQKSDQMHEQRSVSSEIWYPRMDGRRAPLIDHANGSEYKILFRPSVQARQISCSNNLKYKQSNNRYHIEHGYHIRYQITSLTHQFQQVPKAFQPITIEQFLFRWI